MTDAGQPVSEHYPMSVESLCNFNVATIDPGASLADAAARMRDAHVGDLVVTEQRDGATVPVGVVTDRDLVVEVLAAGVDPTELRVGDVMSTEVITVRKDNGLELALRTMHRHGLRRLPVIDAQGALVGIFTLDDVIGYLAGLASHVAETLRVEQSLESKHRP